MRKKAGTPRKAGPDECIMLPHSSSKGSLATSFVFRLFFIRFTEFSIEDSMTGETSICRFRNGLIKLKILDILLDMPNSQLQKQRLLAREDALVHASEVESQRKPCKIIDIVPGIVSKMTASTDTR